jgi:hypothetical protein
VRVLGQIDMKYIAIIVIFLICSTIAFLVLPLRMVSETTYTACSQPAFGGALSLKIDPTFNEFKIPFWFDGLKGESPYRIRVIYTPIGRKARSFVVKSFIIKDALGGVICELSKNQIGRLWDEREKEAIFTVGYLNVFIRDDKIKCFIDASVDDAHGVFIFEIIKMQRKYIVHAGWEALTGI